MTVGLTGGIGSGKSTVSRLLAAHGAVVLDADAMAREVVEVGTPGLTAVVAAFGREVVRADGSLNREGLGRRVFDDADQLAQLNAIMHPLIAAKYQALRREARTSGAAVVVHDLALLVENGLQDRYDTVVVVDVQPATQLDRLVRLRGMTEDDARQRIAAQASREARLAVAEHVLHNDGPLNDLPQQVDRLWERLVDQRPVS